MEEWKNIEGYEGLYQISNYGRVKSLSRKVWQFNKYVITQEFIMKNKNSKDGYKRIILCKDGKYKTFLVHRLVAKHFLNNINNLPYINHKDENKDNNSVDNLEYCTAKYNCNYGNHNINLINSIKRKKKTLQYDLNGNLIKEWISASSASKGTGISKCNIIACCNNKEHYKTAGGYVWRYE